MGFGDGGMGVEIDGVVVEDSGGAGEGVCGGAGWGCAVGAAGVVAATVAAAAEEEVGCGGGVGFC